ncbi:MAG: hypothetical protein H6Q25_724 [Bacteroidetes bacterium]|nr:hypothetical protein [Bacteroidota bacterium]
MKNGIFYISIDLQIYYNILKGQKNIVLIRLGKGEGGKDGRLRTAVGSRQTADGSRQTAVGSRQTAVGRRRSADGSRQTAVGRLVHRFILLLFDYISNNIVFNFNMIFFIFIFYIICQLINGGVISFTVKTSCIVNE